MLTTSRTLQIEWGDCDPSGLVFHPRYFAMFDWSLAVHFQQAGSVKGDVIKQFGTVGMPSVDARAQFFKPLHYGETVRIDTTITEFGRSSFRIEHKLYNAAGELAVEGYSVRVWTKADPDKPGKIKGAPIPEQVKARFSLAK
jgi:4-hydroxybenzoyl-CoA thioesterase